MNEAPTLSNIRKILADILAVNSKPLNIQDIKKVVAEKWNVSVSDIEDKLEQSLNQKAVRIGLAPIVCTVAIFCLSLIQGMLVDVYCAVFQPV